MAMPSLCLSLTSIAIGQTFIWILLNLDSYYQTDLSDEDRVIIYNSELISSFLSLHWIELACGRSFIDSIFWGHQKERIRLCYERLWMIRRWRILLHLRRFGLDHLSSQSKCNHQCCVVEANRREIDFLLFVICGGIWQQHNLSLQTICLRQFSLYRIKA